MSILRQIGEPLVCGTRFPAPREVDRELYIYLSSNAAYDLEFPTPPEVDRELYKKIFIITAILIAVSGPSRGR